jgi:AsmA protein
VIAVLAFVIVVGVVIGGGLAFLFFAAPADMVRERLVAEVRAQTGRTLAIDGPVSLSVFPTTGVTLSAVSLSSPPGFSRSEPLLKARRITVEVGLGALLSQKAEIRRVTLSEPEFRLVVDRNGRRNWEFAALSARVRYAQARGGVRDAAPAPSGRNPDIRPLLAALVAAGPVEAQIDNGRATYRDDRSGETLDVTDISGTASQDARGAAAARGRFAIRGQALDVTARLEAPRTLLSDGKGEVSLKVNGAPVQLGLDGTIRLAGARGSFDGSLAIDSRSLAALGAMLGRPAAAGDNASLSFSSRVAYGDDRLSLVNFKGALAGKPAQGSLAVDLRGDKPRVTGSVDLASLDFGALLLRSADGPMPNSAPQVPVAPGPTRQADPIGDLLRRPEVAPGAPVLKREPRPASAQSREWSDDRLDTHLLSLFDAEVRISASEILHHRLRTGPSRVSINLTDGQLRLDLEDLALYGGRGRGVAVIDAGQAVPSLTLNLNLDGIQGGPFLEDASGFGWIDGRMTVAVVLAGQGNSERDLVQTLSGTAEIKSNGGAVRGFDVAKIMRSIETGEIPQLGIQPNDRTAYSELGASFVVAKGIAQNNDLRLFTQNARVTGSGNVDMPRQYLDFQLKARLTGTGATRAEGALVNFSNIELPLRIEGPWDKPTIGLKGQDQIVDGIRQIGKNLQKPEVQDALKGLFGGGGNNSVKPRDLLDKLLKKE